LFDPFFTTKGRAGTGMGLAVSFVSSGGHSGSIEVESEPGRAQPFASLFQLRARRPQLQQVTSSTSKPSTAADTVRVLVVDDEPAVRDVLREAWKLKAVKSWLLRAAKSAEYLRFEKRQA